LAETAPADWTHSEKFLLALFYLLTIIIIIIIIIIIVVIYVFGPWWLTPEILATWEAEIRKITLQSQSGANSL
jgi:hypothetical protein